MPKAFPWTDEITDRAIAMWNAGKSGSLIAAELMAATGHHLTRSGVISRIHRKGIAMGARPKRPSDDTTRKRIPSACKKPSIVPVPETTAPAAVPRQTTKRAPRPAPLCDKFLPILTLADNTKPCGIVDVTGCRWPVGYDESVPGRHLFCNHEQQEFSPYCAAHRPKPGTLSAEFSGEEMNLIRAHWNKGQGLEWLAIKMKRAKNVVSRQAGRMGLGRAA